MTIVSSDILVGGRGLAQDLRSEGRTVDAQTVDALLLAVEDSETKTPGAAPGRAAPAGDKANGPAA